MHSLNKAAEESFCDANILKARVETTGFCGGDSGHGGCTRVILEDEAGTDISACFSDKERKVIIQVRGDAELRTLIKALRFCAESLDALSGEQG